MKLIQIKPESVDIIWPLVRDLLQKPIDQNLGEFDVEDVRKWLNDN